MVLRYRIKHSPSSGILAEWIEEHDGKTTILNIDLSSLAGEEVIFTLDMEAKSSSDTNEVFWFMPSHQEVGSTGICAEFEIQSYLDYW